MDGFGFRNQIDYAQLQKIYGMEVGPKINAEIRFSPAQCMVARKAVILGQPEYRLFLENCFAVIAKKIPVGFCELLRQFNRLPFERNEVLLQRGLRKEAFQSLAQYNAQFLIERDQARIKGRVVKYG